MKTTYYVVAYWKFEGIDREFEKKLSKSVGKRSGGTGTCFMTMERDISWTFKAEKDAKKAVGKLKRFAAITGVKMYLLEEKKNSEPVSKKIIEWKKP